MRGFVLFDVKFHKVIGDDFKSGGIAVEGEVFKSAAGPKVGNTDESIVGMFKVHTVDDIAELIEFSDVAIKDNGEHRDRSPGVAKVLEGIDVEVKAFNDFVRATCFNQVFVGINGNGRGGIRFIDFFVFNDRFIYVGVMGVKREGAAHIVDRVRDVKIARVRGYMVEVIQIGAIVDIIGVFRVFSIHDEPP